MVGRTHFAALSPDWEAWIGLQILEAMLRQEGLVQISEPTDKRLQLVQAVGRDLQLQPTAQIGIGSSSWSSLRSSTWPAILAAKLWIYSG